MQEELISVIVPIYNSEKYLEECLDSIVRQTYRNLEILLINDGSPDNSIDICKRYEKKDSRIRTISQENQGLSGARNTGIENAHGEYYLFVDADDEIMDTMIEELYNNLIRYDADISICDFFVNRFMEEDNEFRQVEQEEIRVFEGDEKVSKIFNDYLFQVQWNKLFRKKVFRKLRYPLGRIHEDEFVIHKQIYEADRIVTTNRKLYSYRRHPESLVESSDTKRKYDALIAFFSRVDYFLIRGRIRYAIGSYLQTRVIYYERIHYTNDDYGKKGKRMYFLFKIVHFPIILLEKIYTKYFSKEK